MKASRFVVRASASRIPRWLTVLLLVLLPTSSVLSGSVPNTAYQDIASAGPLTHVFLGDEVSAQIAHAGDGAYEFFPPSLIPGDAGTFLIVNDILYAPDFGGHGGTATGGLGAYTALTPVTQTTVQGAGTLADPYRVNTVVAAGATGLRISQTDYYVIGQESYRTDIEVINNAANPQDAILFRAGDCYLGGSDIGYGTVDTTIGSVACSINPNNVPPGRIEQWLPISPGSHYYEASYNQVWQWIGSHQPFPDSCRCNEFIDNGGGLSWTLTIPAFGRVTRSHLTTFSPVGALPLVMQKTADQPISAPGAANGYTISINNPNSTDVTIESISDLLPAGFAYIPGSTTGATTADPGSVGQTLTWSGPIVAPANTTISLHFGVTVAGQSGT